MIHGSKPKSPPPVPVVTSVVSAQIPTPEKGPASTLADQHTPLRPLASAPAGLALSPNRLKRRVSLPACFAGNLQDAGPLPEKDLQIELDRLRQGVKEMQQERAELLHLLGVSFSEEQRPQLGGLVPHEIIKQLNLQYQSLQERNKWLGEENNRLYYEIECLRKTLEAQQIEFQDERGVQAQCFTRLTAHANSEAAEFKKVTEEAQLRVHQLQESCMQKDDCIGALKKTLASEEENHSKAVKRGHELTHELEELQSQLRGTEAEITEIRDKLEAELSELKNLFNTRLDELKSCQTEELARMSESIRAAEFRRDQAEKHSRNDSEKVRDKESALKEVQKELNSRISELSGARTQIRILEDSSDFLKKRLAATAGQIVDLKRELELEKRKETLRHTLNQGVKSEAQKSLQESALLKMQLETIASKNPRRQREAALEAQLQIVQEKLANQMLETQTTKASAMAYRKQLIKLLEIAGLNPQEIVKDYAPSSPTSSEGEPYYSANEN